MKRTLHPIYILAHCVFSFLITATLALAEQPSQTIKVGFILPLSGEWAFLGNGIRDGALLAEQDLKAKGTNIQLIFEDNRGDLAASASMAKKLMDIGKIDAIISIISGVAKVIKPLAAKAHVLNLGICSDTDAADGQYSFVNYLTAEQGVAKFLEYLLHTGNRDKPIGIFSLNEAGFLKIINELKKQSHGSPELRFTEIFDKGTTDFRTILLKAKQTKVETLLILGLSPEIELLVTQARSIGITTPVTSIEGFGLAADKTPFEGSWFIDSGTPNSAFRQRFNAAYSRDITPGVGHAYDSVMLIAKAFENQSNRADAIKKFRKIENLSGVLGALTVKSNGIIWSDASVKLIKNGQPVLLD